MCKVPCSQCAQKSRSAVKCFQCSSVVDLSRQPFGPKETRVCHELSSASCYKDEGEIPRAASCASASLQRVKGFLVATRDRSRRTQCQAKKTGNIEKTIAKAKVGTQKAMVPRKLEHIALPHVWHSVQDAWQISPLCRMPVEWASVLDGTERFHDKHPAQRRMNSVKVGTKLVARAPKGTESKVCAKKIDV